MWLQHGAFCVTVHKPTHPESCNIVEWRNPYWLPNKFFGSKLTVWFIVIIRWT
jgi:hypothetical protein